MGLEGTRQCISTEPVQTVPSEASLPFPVAWKTWHGCVGILNILFSCPQRVKRNRILTCYSEVPFRNTVNQFLVLIIDT